MLSTSHTDRDHGTAALPRNASRSTARMLALIGIVGALAAVGTNRSIDDWTASVIIGGIVMLVVIAVLRIGGSSKH